MRAKSVCRCRSHDAASTVELKLNTQARIPRHRHRHRHRLDTDSPDTSINFIRSDTRDFFAKILARMLVSVSVSASWNASFTGLLPQHMLRVITPSCLTHRELREFVVSHSRACEGPHEHGPRLYRVVATETAAGVTMTYASLALILYRPNRRSIICTYTAVLHVIHGRHARGLYSYIIPY